jgi:hypothetical protein
VQHARKDAVDQHAAGELITLLSTIAFAEGSPPLAIVRNTVRGLGNGSLKDVADVRAQVPKLVPGNVVFLLHGQRSLIFRLIVGGHKVWNDPEDALGDFVLGFFILGIYSRRRPGVGRHLWLRTIGLLLGKRRHRQEYEREQANSPQILEKAQNYSVLRTSLLKLSLCPESRTARRQTFSLL